PQGLGSGYRARRRYGEALFLAGLRAGDVALRGAFRRLRVYDGVPGREVLSRREDRDDLRRDVEHAALDDRQGGAPLSIPWPDAAHPDALARWTRLRSNGRAAFLWRYGVAGWGVPCGIVTVAYHAIKEHALVWSAVIGLFVACGAVGYLLAAWLWDEC